MVPKPGLEPSEKRLFIEAFTSLLSIFIPLATPRKTKWELAGTANFRLSHTVRLGRFLVKFRNC